MSIETQGDLEGIERVGHLVGRTLKRLKKALRPGMTTAEIDRLCDDLLKAEGARSAPRLFYGFPGAICLSVNDEVTHGVPGNRTLRPGDIVKLDVTAELKGYVADAAITVVLPPASPQVVSLSRCSGAALEKGITAARTGRPLNEIGKAIEREVKRWGFSVLPELSGHGVGRHIHDAPARVPNYYDASLAEPLTEGLVLAIEPLISAGVGRVREKRDGWTISTADGSLSAHFEHTVIVREDRAHVVTAV